MKLELLVLGLLAGCSSYQSLWNETKECASKYTPEKDSIPFDSLKIISVPDNLMPHNCGPGCFRRTIKTIYIKQSEPNNTLQHEMLHAQGYITHGVPPYGVCDK